MKTKVFKSAVSVLLVLLLCFSVITPAVSAAEAGTAASGDSEDTPVVALHTSGGAVPGATVSVDDVKNVFEASSLGEGEYYGIKQKSATGNHSYGYAPVNNPGNIKAINLSSGTSFSAGEYLIFSAPYNKNNPDWSVAKVKKMALRTFYNCSFTVTGNENGKIYLNGQPLEGSSAKLYTDEEYTITAEKVEEYFYIMSGVEEGAAFTPSAAVNVKVVYYKEAHATFTLNVNGLGTATVRSDGAAAVSRRV